jgi:glutamine amidotransferase PdxT
MNHMGRGQKNAARPWQTKGGKEPFAALYRDLLQSAAYKHLTASQRSLYVVCASRIFGSTKPDKHQDHFTLTKLDWCDSYGVYGAQSEKSFRRDMTALIEHGFVDCIADCHHSRAPIIYGMSDRWKLYGAAGFSVPVTAMTISMMRARNTSGGVP